jgi:hypothetical protein
MDDATGVDANRRCEMYLAVSVGGRGLVGFPLILMGWRRQGREERRGRLVAGGMHSTLVSLPFANPTQCWPIAVPTRRRTRTPMHYRRAVHDVSRDQFTRSVTRNGRTMVQPSARQSPPCSQCLPL